jgi:hypothetical protein
MLGLTSHIPLGLTANLLVLTVYEKRNRTMEAPKCRLCGNRHYGLCPTTVERELESTPKQTGKKQESLATPEKPAKKPQFDRNAYHKQYMRDYMKEYRKRMRSDQKT